MGIGWQEILIVLVLVMLLFGSARLPSLMRNLGRRAVEFKKGMRDDDDEPVVDSNKP
jgi:sec-independent protein translocase protein TatA